MNIYECGLEECGCEPLEDDDIYVGNLDWDTIQNMEFEDPKEKEWAMWMALGCPEGWWKEVDNE